MENVLYTIGYSGFAIESFIEELKKKKVSVLVDVRSSPFSSFHSEYNKDNLENLLAKNHIYYRNYADEFGARRDDAGLYSENGYLDFEKVKQTASFQNGLSKLIDSISKGYVPALMCAEKDPIDCHRAIMVSKAFYDCGCKVFHIMPNDQICTQNDLEKRLLELYFPERDQFSFFGSIDEEEMIQESYKKRNSEIGFRLVEKYVV